VIRYLTVTMKDKSTHKMLFHGDKSDSLRHKNAFAVPEGYFDTLPNEIQTKLFVERKNLPKETGFSVPKNYFDELTEEIQARVAIERIKEHAEGDAFSVPLGYFESLSAQINQKIEKQTKDKDRNRKKTVKPGIFISLKRRIAYAAAACVIGVLSVAGYFHLSKTQNIQDNHHYSLSEISEDDIINYLLQSAGEEDVFYLSQYFDAELDENSDVPSGFGLGFDDEELEDYLNYGL